ncbi:MAG: ketopantoate reductase family protein [Promethearchaeota archaeon]
MTIYILGMGAIGSLFAAHLVTNGYKVVGLCRGEQFDVISSRGLTYVPYKGEEVVIPIDQNFQVYSDLRHPECNFSEYQRFDWVFVTSKVYSLESLLHTYSEMISYNGYIVLVQNGIGNEELVSKILPNVRIYRTLTTNGALLESPGRVRHTGPGYTKIGYPQTNTLREDIPKSFALWVYLKNSPLFASIDREIDVLLWEKIFVNIGINAIASIYDIPNGGLIETQERKNLMQDAITEAWNVAKAMNISVDETPNRYIEFTYDVCAKTKPNRNSMLQDLDKGRKTEIDFINGKIVEYGKEFDIPTPVNSDLTQQIKKLEK